MMAAADDVERLVRQTLADLGKRAEPGGKEANFEWLVAEVLARLARTTKHANNELVVTARVVTLSELEGKLSGIERLVVPRRAVITPSARDYLRVRNISVADEVAAKIATPGKLSLAWGEAETTFDSSVLVEALMRDKVAIERLARTGLARVVAEVSDDVTREGSLGLVLTGRPALALCLANRRRGVRAVAISTAAATARAVRSAGANLLVVDPQDRSVFELKRTIGQFVAGAPYARPAELE